MFPVLSAASTGVNGAFDCPTPSLGHLHARPGEVAPSARDVRWGKRRNRALAAASRFPRRPFRGQCTRQKSDTATTRSCEPSCWLPQKRISATDIVGGTDPPHLRELSLAPLTLRYHLVSTRWRIGVMHDWL
jgi:hypothetical protein